MLASYGCSPGNWAASFLAAACPVEHASFRVPVHSTHAASRVDDDVVAHVVQLTQHFDGPIDGFDGRVVARNDWVGDERAVQVKAEAFLRCRQPAHDNIFL